MYCCSYHKALSTKHCWYCNHVLCKNCFIQHTGVKIREGMQESFTCFFADDQQTKVTDRFFHTLSNRHTNMLKNQLLQRVLRQYQPSSPLFSLRNYQKKYAITPSLSLNDSSHQ